MILNIRVNFIVAANLQSKSAQTKPARQLLCGAPMCRWSIQTLPQMRFQKVCAAFRRVISIKFQSGIFELFEYLAFKGFFCARFSMALNRFCSNEVLKDLPPSNTGRKYIHQIFRFFGWGASCYRLINIPFVRVGLAQSQSIAMVLRK